VNRAIHNAIRPAAYLAGFLLATALLAGCGSSGGSSSSSVAGNTSKSSSSSGTASAQAPSEAQSAATGDIPDNQVFLTFRDPAQGYTIRYPEGWARKGAGALVSFEDKANVIRVTVAKGPAPTTASVVSALAAMQKADPTIKAAKPQRVTIGGAPVIKVTYSRQSAPDPVTGKRLPLTIDRYVYASGGKFAVVDLGTPKGVDNVDAYRMISNSFRWQ
jgi:hypothetical protein